MSDRRQRAQAYLDVVVERMVATGYPVEATNKSGHRADFIPADTYAWESEKYYTEYLARALIGGWWSKGALIHLAQILIEKGQSHDR